MLKLLIYAEGRDFDLPRRAAEFPNARRPIQLLDHDGGEPGYLLTGDPDEADAIVFPYNLECVVYPERALAASYFIRTLPHYHTHEAKHVFFNFHDHNQPLITNALVVTDDPDRYKKGDPNRACFPHVPGAHVLAASPNRAFGQIRYDTSYVGTLSFPVRLIMSESLRGRRDLNYFIQHPDTLNWEDRQSSYLHMDDPVKKRELERLYIEKMAQSWTTLCPRGQGSSSIRFYETLCMGRIPVHISDAYILPKQDEIDYTEFCLLLPESQADRAGEALAHWLSTKPIEERAAMCLKARQTWERHFRPELFQRYSLSLVVRHVARLADWQVAPRVFGRSELAEGGANKPLYPQGAFAHMEIDDRRNWLVKGMEARMDETGRLRVNGLVTDLGASELLFCTNFAAGLDENAVVVSLAPRRSTGVIALANGLYLGRKLNAALHVAVEGDTAELERDLDATGAACGVRLWRMEPGETQSEFLLRFRPGSVSAVVCETGDPALSAEALARLRSDGLVLSRNRIQHGFAMAPAPKSRVVPLMFESMELVGGLGQGLRPGNLVMGVVANYGWEKIEPFVLSLRQSGFTGEAVLFTMDVKHDVRPRLAEHGIRQVHTVLKPAARHVSVNCLRYFLYHAFLSQFGSQFDNVFLTDVGDVVFQGDVFAHAAPGALTVFGESNLLRDEPWNAGWIMNLYGQQVFEAMAGERVVCSGTTLGPTPLVREYLQRMAEGLLPLQVALKEPAMPGTGMHGTDQGVHNYLLRRGMLPEFRLLTNADGAVCTYDGNYTLLDDGRVATPQGIPYAVVHQYNRNPTLVRHLLSRIAPEHRLAQAQPAPRRRAGRKSAA